MGVVAGGRPTDYNDEVLEIANAYLENFNTEHNHIIPSVVGLAKVLKKSRECLYNWAKEEDKQEFSDILRKINSDQEFELVNQGLSGGFNPAITKLVLGKHGYSEKRELSGDPERPVQVIAREMSADEATSAYKSIIDD